MDENLSGSGKIRRNPRDKKKYQKNRSESVITVAAEDAITNPQPQRSNRRQRNEAPKAPDHPHTSVVQSPPSEVDNKQLPQKDNATVDFSNLKRETEEIERLNKKFAKRNISSNWHRYSAPEGQERLDDGLEEEAPADFSALIQIPSSKGGHLQLKDELEWSSASSEMLGGLFALNLTHLSQSLACIPLYEQLRLPKEMFTEEELKHFDNLASNAKKVYNSTATEDVNRVVLGTLSKILTNSEDTEYLQSNISDNSNSLNLDEENQNSTKINLQAGIITAAVTADIQLSKNNKVDKNVSVSNNKIETSLPLANKNVDYTSLEINSKNSTSSSEILKNANEIKKCKSDRLQESIDLTGDQINSGESTTEETDGLKMLKNNSNSDEISIIQSESIRLTSTSDPKTVEAKVRQSDIKNTFKVEDDDDLDVLLSLTKPVVQASLSNTNTKKPGCVLPSQTSSQPSDLDDWLDSVLQS